MNETRRLPLTDLKDEFQRMLLLGILILLMVFLALHVGNLAANQHKQLSIAVVTEPDDSPFCYKSCTLIHP